MEWYTYLNKSLLDAAYRAGSEPAWNRTDALEVVDVLEQHRYVVLGVDIWIPTDPGPTIPTPFVYDWSLDQVASQIAHRDSARAFIEHFDWDTSDRSHKGLAPYFNLWATLAKA